MLSLHQLLQKLEFPVVAVDVGLHPLIIVLVKGNEKVRLILKIFAVVLLFAEQMERIVVHVGGVAPAEVLLDGAGEQDVFLEYHGDLFPQRLHVVLPHVNAADPHAALCGIVEAGDQLYQRALGAAGAAEDAHGHAGGNVQVNVRQAALILALAVAEADVVEVHAAAGNGGLGVCRTGDVALFVRTTSSMDSGMAILILLLFHIGLFGKVQNGTYILFPFTTVKMVTQLLFVAAIFVHIFINIRPLLVSLGIISYKERRSDIYLILSVLLLFIAGAVILYYIGWQYL